MQESQVINKFNAFLFILFLCLPLQAYTTGICSGVECLKICNNNDCTSIDVCAQMSSQNKSAVANSWLARNSSVLWTDTERSYLFGSLHVNQSYNFFGIQTLYIPKHVSVYLCEPNYRDKSEFCESSSVVKVQGIASSWINITNNRFQLVKYILTDAAACYDITAVSRGFFLDRVLQPNVLSACPGKPLNSSWAACMANMLSCCDFICDDDFDKHASSRQCTHRCALATSTACEVGEFAISSCNTTLGTRYHCQPCNELDGHEVIASTDVFSCTYQKCANNFYSEENTCKACAPNLYSTIGSTQCSFCPLGTTRTTAQTHCQPCFSGLPANAVCTAEHYITSVNVTDILNFWHNTLYDTTTKHLVSTQACAQGYACVGCKAGFFFSDGTCVPCPLNTYQPNYGAASCFDCIATTGTLQPGSDSYEDCLCLPGFY